MHKTLWSTVLCLISAMLTNVDVFFRARQIRGQVDDLEAEIVKGEQKFYYKRYFAIGMDDVDKDIDISEQKRAR